MTTYLSKKLGKMLFPRLTPERRKRLLSKILLILLASLFATASIVLWVIHAIRHFRQSDANFTINF